MKAILGMLALLALAGAASANYAPWYYHTMYKWRCYVPGCDECKAYNPYTCVTCGTGYVLLKDNTCGCAPGFGSYVQPPMDGYPWYPPQSCPTWVTYKSSTGIITKGMVRTTDAAGKRTKAVTLKTWYSTKPTFCTQTYYPTKTCQGHIPVSSVGYCRCFACPTGTSSPGGAITTMAAGCTPGSQPVTRCKNSPPPIDNAKPWNPTKCLNLKPGKACRTTCNTGYTPEPAGTNLTAACTAGGVWKVSGACSAAGAVCKGSPDAGDNAVPFANCTDGAAGATCTSTCNPGFTGTISATCNAATGEWEVASTCVASGAVCAGPPVADGATFLDDCTDVEAGTSCDGTCDVSGDLIIATCGDDGTWIIDGTCNAGDFACPGAPDVPDNAEPFTENQDGNPCENGAVDDACIAACQPGFDGGVEARCLADGNGWSVTGECVEGGGGPTVTCNDLPPDASADNASPWPESCKGTPDGEFCEGTCKEGFNSEGSFAISTCFDDGFGVGTWGNEVSCVAQKKKRGTGH